MSCTAAAEGLAVGALLEGRRGLEADIGEKRLGEYALPNRVPKNAPGGAPFINPQTQPRGSQLTANSHQHPTALS
jgi:hypothetical protein